MNGWQTKRIGEVCDLATGGTPSRSRPEFFGGDIKWLLSGDIHKREIFDCEGRITEAGMKNSNAKLLPVDSVLIALNGQGKTRGTVALLRTAAACNQSMVCMTPKQSAGLMAEFLYANLHGRYEEIRRMTSDDDKDRRGLNMGLIGGIQIPLPPVAEQQRIVGMLDEALAGLATAQAHAESNFQNARGLFESHLQAVFGKRREGWIEKTLEEVSTTFGRGRSKHRPRSAKHLYGGKYPFVQTGDIRSARHVIAEHSQTYSEAGLSQSRLWPKGTICITIAANIAETAILGLDACFPDSVIGMIPDQKQADAGFVEYLLQSFKSHITAQGQGAAQANINLGTFENQRFPFPPVAVQKEITATLDSLSAETQRLESLYQRKLAALAELKKSLLHQAFTGAL